MQWCPVSLQTPTMSVWWNRLAQDRELGWPRCVLWGAPWCSSVEGVSAQGIVILFAICLLQTWAPCDQLRNPYLLHRDEDSTGFPFEGHSDMFLLSTSMCLCNLYTLVKTVRAITIFRKVAPPFALQNYHVDLLPEMPFWLLRAQFITVLCLCSLWDLYESLIRQVYWTTTAVFFHNYHGQAHHYEYNHFMFCQSPA